MSKEMKSTEQPPKPEGQLEDDQLEQATGGDLASSLNQMPNRVDLRILEDPPIAPKSVSTEIGL